MLTATLLIAQAQGEGREALLPASGWTGQRYGCLVRSAQGAGCCSCSAWGEFVLYLGAGVGFAVQSSAGVVVFVHA